MSSSRGGLAAGPEPLRHGPVAHRLRAGVGDHHLFRAPAAVLGDEASRETGLTQRLRGPDAGGVAGDRGDFLGDVAGARRATDLYSSATRFGWRAFGASVASCTPATRSCIGRYHSL